MIAPDHNLEFTDFPSIECGCDAFTFFIDEISPDAGK